MTTVKQFMVDTLKEISEAIEEYNQSASEEAQVGLGAALSGDQASSPEHGFIASSAGRATLIDFDIAITAEETSKAEGGGGIKVVSVFNAGGAIGEEVLKGSTSRVSFKLPLNIPLVDQPEKITKQHEAEQERTRAALNRMAERNNRRY